ncbi:hypothetical protein N9F12_00525 [Burkholderiaceae bacterium]|nr:hypothetical protein [Burkholderiaceae bacterium]
MSACESWPFLIAKFKPLLSFVDVTSLIKVREMADLREIKAVKTQMRLEKVALDAQIRQALLASEALANQVRAMNELQAAQAAQVAQAQAAGGNVANGRMDQYLGDRGPRYSVGDNGEGKRGGKAVQAISRWLSGRG